VGLTAGEEKEFELPVPEDYENKDLAGKTVAFHVRGKEVRKKELPELDDYFASTVGDYENLDQLRTYIESQLQEQAAARAKETAEQEIVEAAISSATVELPEKLLDYEAGRARDRLERSLQSYGMNADQYNRLMGRSDTELADSF